MRVIRGKMAQLATPTRKKEGKHLKLATVVMLFALVMSGSLLDSGGAVPHGHNYLGPVDPTPTAPPPHKKG